MREIGRFALPPGRLGVRLRIGAAGNDGGHALAEAGADVGQPWRSALILHGVVEQGRDGLVLAPAVLEDE
jgi:hypothetical protein